MKNIVVKTTEESSWLRKRAFEKALYFEEAYMPTQKQGSYNACLWGVTSLVGEKYHIVVYHTKTSIVATTYKCNGGNK